MCTMRWTKNRRSQLMICNQTPNCVLGTSVLAPTFFGRLCLKKTGPHAFICVTNFANTTFWYCFRMISIAHCLLFHNNWYFIFKRRANMIISWGICATKRIICLLLRMIWQQMSSGGILEFYEDIHWLDKK